MAEYQAELGGAVVEEYQAELGGAAVEEYHAELEGAAVEEYHAELGGAVEQDLTDAWSLAVGETRKKGVRWNIVTQEQLQQSFVWLICMEILLLLRTK